AAEEREGRVDLAGHEQEHEQRAEPAAAHGPLLEVHVAAAPRHHAQRERQRQEDSEDDERRAHRLAEGEGGGASPAWRRSSAPITAITNDVSSTQPTIHASRSGSPITERWTPLSNGTPISRPAVGSRASQR